MTIIVSYDFYFTADKQPWFYTYTTTFMDANDNIVHSESLNGSDPFEFERLRKDAIDQGFPKDFAYTNPTTKVYGETYRKFWE